MTTLQACIESYLQEVRINRATGTYQNYAKFGQSIMQSLGQHIDIRLIDRQLVMQWLDYKRADWNQNTLRSYMVRAKTFFNWCIKHGYIEQNPLYQIDLPKEQHKLDSERSISHDDREKMLHYTFWRSKRNFAFICLLSSSGARMSALTNLRLPDIDLVKRSAQVIEKGGLRQKIVFDVMTAVALRDYLAERPTVEHDYVWCSAYKPYRRMHYHGMNAMLKSVSRAAGCSVEVNGHMFRHTVAQDWSTNPNVAPVDTQRKLGHANFKTTWDAYYARESSRIESLTDDYDYLPAEIKNRLRDRHGLASDKIIPFPRGLRHDSDS